MYITLQLNGKLTIVEIFALDDFATPAGGARDNFNSVFALDLRRVHRERILARAQFSSRPARYASFYFS